MMRWAIIWLAGASVAGLALSSAFGMAGIKVSPILAAQAFPANGAARAILAENLARARVAAGETQPLNPMIVNLAHDAYRLEPLSTRAVRLLAQNLRERDPARSLLLLEAGNQFSRRNTELNIDLITAYAHRRRDERGLVVLDQLLRRQTPMHGELLTLMAASVARRDLVKDYRQLLARKPPWADQFWRQLGQNSKGIVNAAQLRLQFAADGGTVGLEVDKILVAGLAQAGLFPDATAIAELAVPGSTLHSPGSVIRNADFSREPDMVPFDWTLIQAGDYGASIDPRRRRLILSAIEGARGEIANQLVRLPGTPLTLRARSAAGTDSAGLSQIEVTLSCADSGAGAKEIYQGSLDKPRAMISTGRCRWAWVRLTVAAPSDGKGIDLALEQISLSPFSLGQD